MYRTAVVLTALLTAAASASAQQPAAGTARMEQVVDSYVKDGTFSGSVLVARGTDILFNRAFGLANREWDIPNTPAARFKVASLTKQFTAAAILLLEERGRLRIDDPVKRYLPDAPATWDGITLFHLLTHSAGFPGLQTPADRRQPPVESPDGTVAGFVKQLMTRPLVTPPGEQFGYTNAGYFVLGHLVQTLSGKSYEAFIRDEFLTPLGMKDTGLESAAAVLPRRAVAYSITETGAVHTPVPASDRVVPNSAAGMFSTTADLHRWQMALYGGTVLSKASLQKMTTPVKGDYGLGVYIRSIDGRRAATHGGGVPTYASLTYFLDRGISVIVLGNINIAPAPEIAGFLGALAHGDAVQLYSERKAITLTPATLARYAGVYRMANGQTMTVRIEGTQLAVEPAGGNALPLMAESETRFFIPKVNLGVEFVRNNAGEVIEFVMHQGTRQERAARVP